MKKRKRALAFGKAIAIAALGAFIIAGGGVSADGGPSREGWLANRYIAHAMGSIDGKSMTNSYDAFLANYERGYRLFEADLILTSDGKLAARHDWRAKLQPGLAEGDGGPATLAGFKDAPIYGKYEPMSVEDLMELLRRYPDVYLITDTKETEEGKVAKQFEALASAARAVDPAILNRIVPEIYNPDMYRTVMAIYPFPNKIYSLYQTRASVSEVVAFAEGKGFSAVAMPVSRALLDPTLPRRLKKIGLVSYVHTLDSRTAMDWLGGALGVYGFYTNSEAGPGRLEEDRTSRNALYLAEGWICIVLAGSGTLRLRSRSRGTTKTTKAEKRHEQQLSRARRGRRGGNSRGA